MAASRTMRRILPVTELAADESVAHACWYLDRLAFYLRRVQFTSRPTFVKFNWPSGNSMLAAKMCVDTFTAGTNEKPESTFSAA